MDKEPKLAAQYGVMSLPTTIWIDDTDPKLTLVGPADEGKLSQALYTAREK